MAHQQVYLRFNSIYLLVVIIFACKANQAAASCCAEFFWQGFSLWANLFFGSCN